MTTTEIPTAQLVRSVDGHQVPAAGPWAVDPSHTTVEFVTRHMMVTKVRGRFSDYTAEVVVGERPEDSTLTVELQAASISTGDDGRDGHLRSPDFLDAEQHPVLRFTSTSVVADGSHWKVTGDFTIRDITKPLTLDVEFGGVADDPWGNKKAFFSASAEFDREDWNLTWNQPLANGGVLVGKKIRIELEIQAAYAGVA